MAAQSPGDKRLLVFGTGNRHKAVELASLLVRLNVEVRSLADFGDPLPVDEIGTTFAENAALKATRQAAHLKQWVLADDSGLCVDALGGAPGIHSARYAGLAATDAMNRQRLLDEMRGIAAERRDAHFVCSLALADPTGALRATADGRCHGRIRADAAGSGGFGYDPLFEIREYHRTFGELSAAAKDCLSHRARAIAAMIPAIETLLLSGQWGARG